jgi:hypothetical protein
VRSAAHRDVEGSFAGEPDRGDHVRRRFAAGDHSGMPVDTGVPHRPRFVVPAIVGRVDGAAHRLSQGLDRRITECLRHVMSLPLIPTPCEVAHKLLRVSGTSLADG